MKALRAELREIEAATAAVQDSPGSDGARPAATSIQRSGPTLKEMAIAILMEHPDGLEANDVRDQIAEKFGTQVKRESMSPQLSRLAREGVIRRGGHNKWLLKTQGSMIAAEKDRNIHIDPPEEDDLADLLG